MRPTPPALPPMPAPTLALLLALAAAPALAGEHAHGAQAPHVHGEASLDIAWEGGTLEVRLESPADNLLGFEHAPASDAERAALASAVAALKDGTGLFRFPPGAGCTLAAAAVESELLAAAPRPGHGTGEAHADLDADYRFDCAAPERLSQIEVGLFRAFPGIRDLRVRYAGPFGQGAGELSAADPVLRLQ